MRWVSSATRSLSYNVEHTDKQILGQTNQAYFLPDAHPGVGLGARPRIQIEAHARTEVYSCR
jgi:hypothetical protein